MAGGSLLRSLPLEGLSSSRLWAHLDPGLRALAARSLYAHDWGDAPTRREADLAVAQALRSREASVRRLPVEKRALYLARLVRPNDRLASSLLLAFHLKLRRPLLGTFLDALGIPHRDGLISDDHGLGAPEPAALARAASTLFVEHAAEEVETYLAALLAMDPDVWGGLAKLLHERAESARLDDSGT